MNTGKLNIKCYIATFSVALIAGFLFIVTSITYAGTAVTFSDCSRIFGNVTVGLNTEASRGEAGRNQQAYDDCVKRVYMGLQIRSAPLKSNTGMRSRK